MRTVLLAIGLSALLAGCTSPTPESPVATGQIDGAVLDHLLQPFDGQAVYLVQLGMRDDSSPLGGFTFRNVPVGTYTLLATRDGYRSATIVLDVEPDRITKTILQLLPIPVPDPYFETTGHRSSEQVALPGTDCPTCSWDVPVRGGPKEIILEGRWTQGTLLSTNHLEVQVQDDLGMTLFHGNLESPMTLSFRGEDLREEVRHLNVTVHFGQGFTTQTRFHMDQTATSYYGATRCDLFYLDCPGNG